MADAFFFLHTINAYEDDNHLVLDICCYKNAKMLDCMYIEALQVLPLYTFFELNWNQFIFMNEIQIDTDWMKWLVLRHFWTAEASLEILTNSLRSCVLFRRSERYLIIFILGIL